MDIKGHIDWSDFSKIDMVVGTIIKASYFEKARKPAYILIIDFGEFGIKKSSAQITKLYTIENLIDKQIIGIINFPYKQIANIKSECLVLGALGNESNITLLSTDLPVKNGLRIG